MFFGEEIVTMTSKSITAVLFIFRPGRDRVRAALTSCSGWVRHAVKFRESGTYEFTLDSELSQGSAEVYLLDGKKQPQFKLSLLNSSQEIYLEAKSKCYLRWEFKSASGKCELRWQKK